MNTATPRKKKRWLVLAAVAAVIAVSIGACAVYVNDYYRADTTAVSALTSRATVTVETLDDGSIAFRPDEPVAGFIFYPGGKVDHTAYAPLMQACAERGILCVLVKMPLRLAVLDINAADGIAAQYPAVTDWYIGGHSLGGSMAATYLDKHRDDFAGLILLGSYSTADLSDSSLSVLSVYGSEDRVLNAVNYA